MVNPTPIDSPTVGFISIEEAQKPISGVVKCYVDYWFCVHERGIVCHVRRQRGHRDVKIMIGNSNKEVAERMRDMHWPWAEVKQISVVYNRYADF
jgi:hypothetical protein